jgi:hypothetical protein
MLVRLPLHESDWWYIVRKKLHAIMKSVVAVTGLLI